MLEETKRENMCIETGRRAVRYEEKNRMRKDKEIVWVYIKEMNKRKEK